MTLNENECKFWDSEHDRNELLLDIYAVRFEKNKGYWPILIDQEKYEYFDEWCIISEAKNGWGWESGGEVTVENRNGTIQRVAMKDLGWKFGRIFDHFARKGFDHQLLCKQLLAVTTY